MGDVAILIGKGGKVIDLSKGNKTGNGDTDTIDNEDGDDIDEDGLSGSGSTDLPITATDPVFTPTTTPVRPRELTSSDNAGATTPIIIGAVVGAVVIVVIVVVLVVVCRRRRRRRLEKSNSTKPLPHPASMDMSAGSAATLPARPTGDGYYSTAVPLAALYPPPPVGEDLPPPTEPPPPPPSTKKSPSQSKPPPGSSARYTKLKPGGGRGADGPPKEKSENIYETIDDYAVGGASAEDDCEVYLVASSTKSEKDDHDVDYIDDDDDVDGQGGKETDRLKC